MKHVHFTEIKEEPVDVEGAKDATIRWVITNEDGAKNFAMRIFDIQPGGYTPLHEHDWEHEMFIIEGSGEVRSADGSEPLRQGDVVFVPAGDMHQLFNSSDKLLRVMCLIPYKKE